MRVLIIVLLINVLFLSEVAAAVTKNVHADAAYKMLAGDNGIFLLDVRTPGEYREIRLNGARLIQIDQLVKRIGELPKNQPILVYCAVGSRSAQVVNYLARRGYPELYNLYGGIYSWAQKGLPVLRGSP